MENSLLHYDYSLLPSHVLAKVLANLQFSERLTAIQTCKSWYYASWEPIISQNTLVKIKHDEHTQRKFSDLKNLNRPFGKLSLSVNFEKFQFRSFFKKHGHHIRDIVFSYCRLSFEQLIECLRHLTNLTSLELSYNTKVFTIDRLAVLNTNYAKPLNQNLQSVKAFHCNVDRECLNGLRLIMPMLVNLETIEYSTLGHFNYDILIDYFKQFDDLKLKHLWIKSQVKADFFESFANIKTKFNLHSLFLPRFEYEYYDRNFEIFCMKLSNLRVLKIEVTEKRLIDICRYLTKLNELEIAIPRTGRFHFVRTLQTLKKLIITSEIYETEQNDADLIEFLSVPLQNLHTLHIRHHISSTVLAILCDNYKHLTELYLSELKSSNIKAIYKNMVNLRSLELHTVYFPFDQETIADYDLDYNITNLKLLETLILLKPLPGATLDLIKQLPNLTPASMKALERSFNVKSIFPDDDDEPQEN